VPTERMNNFLRADLKDALKWLFVGAIVWQAAKEKKQECCSNQDALGMFTSFMQARSLYEFYYGPPEGKDDDARAEQFARTSFNPKSSLGARYMYKEGEELPVNKRLFHMVYGRSEHDEINDQVLSIAQDLQRITKEFAEHATPEFKPLIEGALDDALNDADYAASKCSAPLQTRHTGPGLK
jgi:hypothetical protein